MSLPGEHTDVKDGGDAPLSFFALVGVLSGPFWIAGAVADRELMPGLPLAGLMFVCPALAALILRAIAPGRGNAAALLARAVDLRRLRPLPMLALLLLLNPAIFTAAYFIQRGLAGNLPAPNLAPGPTLGLFAIFLVGALGEELGWTGYALEPLQRRWGELRASLIIGAVWAGWHFIALAQVGRAMDWIAWWALWTVSARILMVWLYNRTGRSVFGIALYHTLSNLCWQAYPVHGSYFDPRLMALLTLGTALALVRPWRRAASGD